MIHKIFDELKLTDRLPSPTGVGLRILHLTERDESSAEELASVIMADPALTGQLLRLANAAQFASVEPITTVSDAAVRLGTRALRNVALGLSLITSHRRGVCARFDYDRYWSASLARAIAAQHVSRLSRLASPAEAYTVALLSDIGTLSLASVHPAQYSDLLAAGVRDVHELARMEQEAFEIDHCEVAACLLREWGLSVTCSQAVLLHERNTEGRENPAPEIAAMVRVLRLARMIAGLLTSAGCDRGDGETPERWRTAIEGIHRELQVERRACADLLRAAAGEWVQWTALFDLPKTDGAQIEELLGLLEEPMRATDDRRVPNTAPAGGEAPPSCSAPQKSTGLRVLAVDDDPLALKILAKTLVAAGHEVLCASGGREALELALTTGPELVIADWSMKDMDGLDLCRALRSIEAGRNMYFLLLTGRVEEDLIVEAFDAGIDDYIAKPCSARVLMARLKGGQRVIRLMEQVEKDHRLIVQQVKDTAKLRRKLHMASLTDELTGLPNRRHAIIRLTQEWQSACRSGRPLSVVMIDIDHFKRVNDTYGHDGGDIVLKEVSRLMKEKVRMGEEPARLGGEEFLVVCGNTTREQAAVQAERVRAAVEAGTIAGERFTAKVTVSLGVAGYHPDMVGYDSLIKAADEAVYQAKARGRNRVVVAGSRALREQVA